MPIRGVLMALACVAACVFLCVGGSARAEVFLDQPPSHLNTDAYTCQDYDQFTDSMDTFIADDFAVPAGQVWRIDEVVLYGDGWHGLSSLEDADSVSCHIYNNASFGGSRPAGYPTGFSAGIWHETWPIDNVHVTILDAFDVRFEPDAPPVLGRGTYWMVCYPTLSYIDHGAWGMRVTENAHGEESKITNPGGGTGYLPISWGDLDNYFDIDQTDVAWRLSGAVILPTTTTTTHGSTTTTHGTTTTTHGSTTTTHVTTTTGAGTTTTTDGGDDDDATDDDADDDTSLDDDTDDDFDDDLDDDDSAFDDDAFDDGSDDDDADDDSDGDDDSANADDFAKDDDDDDDDGGGCGFACA
ncbi:hypothetical protein K8I61_16845 [bacterium]|nr:hypothetical protein [bacterium]